jgi:hypothetical protein
LSIGALVLGILLFGKRELLKGRAQKLENAIIQLGALIEEEAPQSSGAVQYPERDISPNALDFLDDQEFSSFWPSYSNSYELADAATMKVKRRENELMAYFKRTPDGKVIKNARGFKVTDGEGTMQGLLDEIIGNAEDQYNLLNDTRQQLADIRAELVATIQDLNQSKTGYRQALLKIQNLEADIARLEADLRKTKDQLAEARDTIRSLEDQLAEERRQLQLVEELKVQLEDEVEQLKEELEQWVGKPPEGSATPSPAGQGEIVWDPGEKGKVVSVNATWNFVIIALSDAALNELLGDEDSDQPLGLVEFMVKREIEGEDTFVTKVQLQKVRRDEKLAIASILSDWQQMDVEEGDIVFK